MKGHKTNSTAVEVSSGNVFADLFLPEAKELKELANIIHSSRNGITKLSNEQIESAKKYFNYNVPVIDENRQK